MTQPTPLQADVHLRTIRANDARQALSNPVEIRNGAVRSITLTIPLLTDSNSYLVVRLPDQVVSDMIAHVRTLPEAERSAFIREWVMRNQQAVIEQHIRSGGHDRRFRYDVVPVQAQPPRVQDATPRRVEQPPQPSTATATPSRREAQATVPPQTAPPQTAPPQPAPQQPATRGRVIQPGGAPSAPVVVTPGPTISTPGPTERPVAPPAPRQAQLPPFPSQIRGGNGSTRSPYAVYKSEAEIARARRQEGREISQSIIVIPYSLVVENLGTIQFSVAFEASQITQSRRGRTSTELWGIMSGTFQRIAAERGINLERDTGFREARRRFGAGFAASMRLAEQSDEDIGAYLRGN